MVLSMPTEYLQNEKRRIDRLFNFFLELVCYWRQQNAQLLAQFVDLCIVVGKESSLWLIATNFIIALAKKLCKELENLLHHFWIVRADGIIWTDGQVKSLCKVCKGEVLVDEASIGISRPSA